MTDPILQQFIEADTEKLAINKGMSIFEVHPNFWNQAQKYKPCWYQTSVQKWLRDIHKIVISIVIFHSGKYTYVIHLFNEKSKGYVKHSNSQFAYSTYEEALEEGLKYGLTLIK